MNNHRNDGHSDEEILYELGFAVRADRDINAYLSAPKPVEMEDRRGQSWEIYRHIDYPRDLQLWVSNSGNVRIKLKKLGRLREGEYEFTSLSERKLVGRLKKAMADLQDISEYSPNTLSGLAKALKMRYNDGKNRINDKEFV